MKEDEEEEEELAFPSSLPSIVPSTVRPFPSPSVAFQYYAANTTMQIEEEEEEEGHPYNEGVVCHE